MTAIFNRPPDVEVYFQFNGTKNKLISDGYRPAHLIKSDYLTTGVHHYYNKSTLQPNESDTGTITFITPEAYPNSLREGQKINIQEGSKVVGHATILKIFNPILKQSH